MPRSLEQFDFARPRLLGTLTRKKALARLSILGMSGLLPTAIGHAAGAEGWLATLAGLYCLAYGPTFFSWISGEVTADREMRALREEHRALTGQELPAGEPAALERWLSDG